VEWEEGEGDESANQREGVWVGGWGSQMLGGWRR
jgi:hypothetical protein